MIDGPALTGELITQVTALVDDLRSRADEEAEVRESVTKEWRTAFDTGRTAHNLETWREDLLTQVGVSWVLGCVFVRFCEDNRLLGEPRLSGPGDWSRWAQDAQTQYFREHRAAGERDYLLHVFGHCAGVNGLSQVFGAHNPLWRFGPSDDACRALIELWRQVDEQTGARRWNFTDPGLDTRFLGDLYQDLSVHAKKTYALLQTPGFIEEFILDRTLEPAIEEFGLDGGDGKGFRMIDPSCGSGHFLLGGFARLAQRHRARDPQAGAQAAATRALENVFGVDLNPAAAAIARFRLLLAALAFAGVKTLAEAPNFTINVAVGDSLLHGPPPARLQGVLESAERQASTTAHLYQTEDAETVGAILGQDYHAVVANPPYITAKDPAANRAYRSRYGTCYGKYLLAVPFMERLFDLARRGAGPSAGYVGQITSNSFMRQEVGRKLVERYLADEVDLTHVVDSSGVPIPGRGRKTVILLGRNRFPKAEELRVARGIRGEPDAASAADPARGRVWTSILDLLDQPGSENDYLSVDDIERKTLRRHPWSMQGGAAADLQRRMESRSTWRLESIQTSIGFNWRTGTDGVFIARRRGALARRSVEGPSIRDLVNGEALRDWGFSTLRQVLFPYTAQYEVVAESDLPIGEFKWLWPQKAVLGTTKFFGKDKWELGVPWHAWLWLNTNKFKVPLSIGFPSQATHNHFVLDRGESDLYRVSAPVIKLSADTSLDDHLQLLGLLNSALACFWMKQIFHRTGGGAEAWTHPYSLSGTKLKQFPRAAGSVLDLTRALDEAARELATQLPAAVMAEAETLGRSRFDRSREQVARLRAEMVWLQEELDWRCLYLYGATDTDLSFGPEAVFGLHKGQRAFEITLARDLESGETKSTWFAKHDSSPITAPPPHWPAGYQDRVKQRLSLIKNDRLVNLAERCDYKRRWAWPSWDDLAAEAQRDWLLNRLEDERLWSPGQVRSVAQLADDVQRHDPDFVAVAELYCGGQFGVDLVKLVTELTADEAVPYLAAECYKESGLRKRAAWEATWVRQRGHDAGDHVGEVPVPPNYTWSDFRSKPAWALRGKLDVANERFISYPGAERAADDTPVLGWAGWDHLQQAEALAHLFNHREQSEGWDAQRLTPLLAGLAELVPWLRQWHNENDPTLAKGLGDTYADYLAPEMQRLGLSAQDLAAWRPPKQSKGRKKKATP